MSCTFFGHRDATDGIKAKLKKSILYLIEERQVERFLVGNNGNFDLYVQCVLIELKKEGVNIRFDIVLSRPEEKALSGNQEVTLFPEGMEYALPRYAVSKRNAWLIKNASFAIVYVRSPFSNSNRWMKEALRKGLTVINLFDESINFPEKDDGTLLQMPCNTQE